MRQAFRYALVVGTAFLTVLGVVGFILAPQLMALFRADDQAVIEIGAFAMRAQCLTLMFQPVSVLSNMTFQTVGRSWQATFVSSCRQGVFFLPFIYLAARPLWADRCGNHPDSCRFLHVSVLHPFSGSFFPGSQKGRRPGKSSSGSTVIAVFSTVFPVTKGRHAWGK